MHPGMAVSLATVAMILAVPSMAQDHSMMHSHSAPAASPYSGMEARPIKALSDQQIADLKAGRGMGLALAAELNGYPGPAHVLELADQLGLSDDQRARVKGLFDAMKAETVPLGEKIIGEETELDRRFRDGSITPATLDALTEEIGAEQGHLRSAHLRYHLATVDVLSPPQIAHYRQLRGYAAGEEHGGGHHPAE